MTTRGLGHLDRERALDASKELFRLSTAFAFAAGASQPHLLRARDATVQMTLSEIS